MAKKKTKKQWGGARPGSGPKSQFKEKIRLLVNLEKKHHDFLQKVATKMKLRGRGPALRQILDLHMRRARNGQRKGK